MVYWWIRPVVRMVAALLLPLLVPAVIAGLIWLIPGDPVEIICPKEICTGGEELARRWHLDQGPMFFYINWMGSAFEGDLGASWRYLQGIEVAELLLKAIPNTVLLVLIALVPISLGTFLGSSGRPSEKWDPLLFALSVIPIIVLSLTAAAIVEVNFGGDSYEGIGWWSRMIAAALTLGIADGALSGAITGFRSLFLSERKQRYVGIALLRGETSFSNTFPNVVGAAAGQFRARIVHLLSGAVVVEIIVGIEGVGDLLWNGTLKQDFGVVLGSAVGFALISGALLFGQALVEIVQMKHIRKAPTMPKEGAQ